MKLRFLSLLFLPSFSTGLHGQTNSVEVCGVPFRLGMTRQQMKASLIIQPLSPDAMRTFFGRDWVSLNPLMFGLPKSVGCYGELHFTRDRVDEIQKTVLTTDNAITLTRSLFLEVRKLAESNEAVAVVEAWANTMDEKDGRLLFQGIKFKFGEHTIEIDVEDGKILDTNVGPTTTLKVGIIAKVE